MVAVEHDLDMQAVVTEQPPARAAADRLFRIAQGDAAVRIAQIGPQPLGQRYGLVEEGLGPRHHARAACRIEGPRRWQVA